MSMNSKVSFISGFSPTSFASSRTNRQSTQSTSVDTYMDEEDISGMSTVYTLSLIYSITN